MEKRLQNLYEDTFSLYTQLASTAKWASEQVRLRSTDPEYCADVAFAMSELNKLIKDIGVEIRKALELSETVACVTWLRSADEEPIRTEHCTATPRLQLQPKLPPKDSPELHQLLDWLGVKENHDSVRIHWPTFCDLVSKRTEESLPLPPGINPAELHNPNAKLKFYKRKEVTE